MAVRRTLKCLSLPGTVPWTNPRIAPPSVDQGTVGAAPWLPHSPKPCPYTMSPGDHSQVGLGTIPGASGTAEYREDHELGVEDAHSN